MDLIQLEMFQAVARHGSIAAAAQAVHRVPSNLTTRIKQLEEELGVDLFTRERNRLQLSQPGRVFLDYASRILGLVSEARAVTAGQQPAGRFALGALESTAAVRIPGILAAYNQRFPQVALELATGPSGQIIDALLGGDLIAAFVDGPLDHPELTGFPVFDEQMVVVAPSNHAPIRRGRDADGDALYVFRKNCSYRRHLERWLANDGAVHGEIRELESYHGMLACVSAGGGLAIMPLSMLESMPGSQTVRAWPMGKEFGLLRTWLVWRKETISKALEAFTQLVKASASA
ncbi:MULTISPECIES: putrescine utilization regulator PtrR [Burkholderia]|jgi:DNA-binding transcriptional LysR family regulator|uniref:Bacterial regulatory helix-turn-helix, lysR family protein n=3 Tax=Burkholderia TaxID=32008 RepID=A0A095W470_BURGA|nr:MULTISPECIES: LysR family transcriptional regulator [Burkholderia]AEA64485.1 LysR family transcriptional regulator [Burkholderia gladioli BSR3]AJW94233.1 bacterial regulatory helix-turn-helix, lysR family protein [Burkholderia gladioli]ASD81567.1 LysR family transcriptional regulator [Burkholderia gladioli pv. gladioli]ATF88251.1 LysR family transcriptional regulator [Burkholderia gladioli pv. gladioli]AWY51823.1 LysR family transcriptional regulator [Burkholderia gladioli pv. gladioli]